MIPEGVLSELQAYFLAAKYAFVLLFVLFLLALRRWPRPPVLVIGALAFTLYTYVVALHPTERPWGMEPGRDRLYNLAMSTTAATGHSPFESYQVGVGDHEPFWRLVMRGLSLGDPENVALIYPWITPVVLVLLALALYLVPRRGEAPANDRRWELALTVYAVLLLSSSAHEANGIFDTFWLMTFMLKPNHVLGFVLLPFWIRALSSERAWANTWLAAAILALVSWVFLLHWAYWLSVLVCLPVVARYFGGRPPKLGRLALIGGISGVVAFPYIRFLFSTFPPDDSTVGRLIWESTAEVREGYYNVFSIGFEHGALFLLSIAGMVLMFRRRSSEDLVWLSLVAGCVLGWLAYLLAFSIRRIIEPEEFYFFTRFVLSVCAGSGAFYVMRAASGLVKRLDPFTTRALPAFLLVTMPLALPYWWNPPEMDRYYPDSLRPIPSEMQELSEWVLASTSPDDVFMASPDTASWIAAMSGRRVLLTGDYRPPNSYEARQSLTEELLTTRDASVFATASSEYGVTHLVLDRAYLEPLSASRAAFDELSWLRNVFESGELGVYAIDESRLAAAGDR